jgi:hypothetical protein
MRHQVSKSGRAFALLAVCVASSASCGDAIQGRSPAYLTINALLGAAGVTPQAFSGVLASDVLTFVKKTVNGQQVDVPTVFEDNGQVTLTAALKNQGSGGTTAAPTPVNSITVDRYHVKFVRSDGRNVAGVDVPFEFDGGVTGTVSPGGTATMAFTLVRLQAKVERPLGSLVGNGGAIVISTIAEVTFYGHDQAGNAVSVTGKISVNFSDWGDPG